MYKYLLSYLNQDDAGDHHGLSQATTSRICARVARALARHSNSHIKIPSTFAEEEQIMREFTASLVTQCSGTLLILVMI